MQDSSLPEPAGKETPPRAIPVAAAAQSACVPLLEQGNAQQAALGQAVADLTGQTAFVRQQVSQLYEAVRQLYDANSLQCQQRQESDQATLRELQRFQTGAPQRAMASVFHKLFRDLIAHVAQLDDLVSLGEQGERTEAERAWIAALRIARDQFERVLTDWGCLPIAVEVGREEFDPEHHEAADPQPGEIPPGTPDSIIVKVRRRGWKLQDYVLRHPAVVVS